MTQWLRPPGQQGPGIGEQLAKKAAANLAAKEAAKLGLGAAGTAIGGPLGGAAGTAVGELAGPLAGQLVGSLFNKGGAVYKTVGGGISFEELMAITAGGGTFEEQRKKVAEYLQGKGQQTTIEGNQVNSTKIPTEETNPTVAPTPVDRAIGGKSGGSGSWNIPLGNALGADWSTSGDVAAGTRFDDGSKSGPNWNAGIKGTWTFDKGGEVDGKKKSIWDSVKSAAKYAVKNDNLAESKGRWKNAQYKAIGGMTSGPLGMPDMLAAGKGKDVSKVKMKKNKGDMSEEVEVNYHAPLAPKPTGE